MKLNKEQLKIVADRTQIYGDPKISHTAIGYAIRGVLQNAWQHLDVPEVSAALTAEILAVFKVVRAARPVVHLDSQTDAQVFLEFSKEFKE